MLLHMQLLLPFALLHVYSLKETDMGQSFS
jgi:hypothetical protein